MKRILSLLVLSIFVTSYGITAIASENGYVINPSRGTSSKLLYELKPGGEMIDSVKISNGGKEDKTFSLFVTDKIENADPKSEVFLLSGKGEVQKGVGLWTKLDKTEVTLKAGESKNIEFTLRIPSDVKNETAYEGAVVMAEIPKAKKEQNVAGKDTNSVNIMSQVGLRLYVKVTDNPQLTDTTGSPKAEKTPDEKESKNSNNMIFALLGILIIAAIGYIISKKKK